MRIDSSGRVGIGTTSPANHLEVVGAIVAQGAATAYTNTGLYLQNKGSSVFDVGAWRSGASVAELTFSTDSGSDAAPVERMRIDSSGNVGIGTSSPTGRLNLVPVGNIGGSGGTMTNAALRIGTAANSSMYFDTNEIHGSETLNFFSNGTDNGGADYIRFSTGGTAGTERMRINSSGNVGIGTATPEGRLQANAASAFDPAIIVRSDASVSNWARMDWKNSNVVQTGIIYLDSGGLFSIRNDGASPIAFYTNGANERMRIDSSGNVGIGTASPVKRLTISGASNGNITTLTDAATITPDLDSSDMFTVTLGGNRTLANPSNRDAGQTGSIFIVQDGTGSRTLAWGSYWDFAGGTAPTLSTAAGAVDRVDFIVRTSTSIHTVFTANYS